MPYHEADADDPHVLVGVSLPGGRDDLRRMVEVFVEEFAALGFDEEHLLRLFRHPGYAAAHRAWRELGEAEIGRIVRECMALWGRFRVVVTEPMDAREPAVPALIRLRIGTDDRGPEGG